MEIATRKRLTGEGTASWGLRDELKDRLGIEVSSLLTHCLRIAYLPL